MNKIEALKKKDNLQISEVSSKEVFGILTDIKVPKFNEASEYCPKLDTNYVFDESTTIAILLGLKFNKRVFLQGLHGTCLLYTSPSPRDLSTSRMPSSA